MELVELVVMLLVVAVVLGFLWLTAIYRAIKSVIEKADAAWDTARLWRTTGEKVKSLQQEHDALLKAYNDLTGAIADDLGIVTVGAQKTYTGRPGPRHALWEQPERRVRRVKKGSKRKR